MSIQSEIDLLEEEFHLKSMLGLSVYHYFEYREFEFKFRIVQYERTYMLSIFSSPSAMEKYHGYEISRYNFIKFHEINPKYVQAVIDGYLDGSPQRVKPQNSKNTSRDAR